MKNDFWELVSECPNYQQVKSEYQKSVTLSGDIIIST